MTNTLDPSAMPFLWLYVVLLLAAVAASLAIPRWLRPEGRARTLTDVDELAYLAGGRIRVADAIVSRLLARRELVLDGRNRFLTQRGAGDCRDGEHAVLSRVGPLNLSSIDDAVRPYASRIDGALIAMGAIIDQHVGLRMRLWQTAPYLLLLGLGILEYQLAGAREKPAGLLIAAMLATLVLAVARFVTLDRRSRGGAEVLRRAREQADRLRRAATGEEVDRAVALFGTEVLVGSAWAPLHDMRRAAGESGADIAIDGGDAGDGGGGDAGCGGGCGGCGS